MNDEDNHSEKMRRIMNQKPAYLVRWGNTWLLVLLLLLAAAWWVWQKGMG